MSYTISIICLQRAIRVISAIYINKQEHFEIIYS